MTDLTNLIEPPTPGRPNWVLCCHCGQRYPKRHAHGIDAALEAQYEVEPCPRCGWYVAEPLWQCFSCGRYHDPIVRECPSCPLARSPEQPPARREVSSDARELAVQIQQTLETMRVDVDAEREQAGDDDEAAVGLAAGVYTTIRAVQATIREFLETDSPSDIGARSGSTSRPGGEK